MKEIEISRIEGIRIGHATDEGGGTGCTAILCEKGAFAGVDVRGGGPASRETELLKPVNLVEQIHCVMLSGGSAYGLAAGDGAMAFLEEQGIGFDVGVGVVPIVCGASLFDLVVGDPKARPDKAMGYEACKHAMEGSVPEEGNAGAGTGASVGKYLGVDTMMKSGLGIYCVETGGVKVGAVVAVNALGDITDPETGEVLAGILTSDKSAIGSTFDTMMEELAGGRNVFSGNTTLGCIVTNGKLTKSQANKVASIAHNGFARTIRPVHTSFDGDTIFVMATGEAEVSPDALGALAAEVMAKAVCRAVLAAKPAYGLPAASDFRNPAKKEGAR